MADFFDMEACIRNVSADTWKYLKTEAAKSGLPLGRFLEVVADEHKRAKEDPWKEILHGKKIFTEAELDEITERCADFRKRFRFR
jgi:hypothetical protein